MRSIPSRRIHTALLICVLCSCGDDGPPDAGITDAASDVERGEDVASDSVDASDAGTTRWGLVDFHSHCFEPDGCDVSGIEGWQDGELFVVAASLEHYAISASLGDVLPPELERVGESNEITAQAAADSEHVGMLPSLECLYDTPASDPAWLSNCLEDADRWLEAGALGFKDHAGKTFADIEGGRWVGAFNRYAGWCDVPADATDPNLVCQEQSTMRFPLSTGPWRELLKTLTEDRAVPVLTHAIPYFGGTEQCGTPEGTVPCFQAAVAALLDFARWATENMTPEARRRVVIAHLGFLQNEPEALTAIADAGFTLDIAQTLLASAGCALRRFVSLYPEQVVLGTDINVGQPCGERSYNAWRYALTGPAGEEQAFTNTCRGTMQAVGADLDNPAPGACDIAVTDDAAERVMFRNAVDLLGI